MKGRGSIERIVILCDSVRILGFYKKNFGQRVRFDRLVVDPMGNFAVYTISDFPKGMNVVFNISV
jgi:hypothetical protein